jgi:hypothetical protein
MFKPGITPTPPSPIKGPIKGEGLTLSFIDSYLRDTTLGCQKRPRLEGASSECV